MLRVDLMKKEKCTAETLANICSNLEDGDNILFNVQGVDSTVCEIKRKSQTITMQECGFEFARQEFNTNTPISFITKSIKKYYHDNYKGKINLMWNFEN